MTVPPSPSCRLGTHSYLRCLPKEKSVILLRVKSACESKRLLVALPGKGDALWRTALVKGALVCPNTFLP